jgi:hypothetical protein
MNGLSTSMRAPVTVQQSRVIGKRRAGLGYAIALQSEAYLGA